MRQAEEITNESWPVGGTRLRPSLATNAPWASIGNVAAAPAQPAVEAHQHVDREVDDDWEKLLAAALGVAAPTSEIFSDPDVEVVETIEVVEVGDAPVVFEETSDGAHDVLGSDAGEAAAPRLPGWTGDDILPYSRNRRNRRNRRSWFRR